VKGFRRDRGLKIEFGEGEGVWWCCGADDRGREERSSRLVFARCWEVIELLKRIKKTE